MPKAKEPIKVNEKIIVRTGEMDDTQLPYIFVDNLIGAYHPHLAEAEVVFYYQFGWKKPDGEGRIKISDLKIYSKSDRQLHGKDFKIVLNYNYWHNAKTDDDNKKVTIDRELCKLRIKMDNELNIPKRDEFGKVVYYDRDYDIKDFNEVIERWGIRGIDQERTAEIMANEWEKVKDRLEKLALDEIRSEGLDSSPDGGVEGLELVGAGVGSNEDDDSELPL